MRKSYLFVYSVEFGDREKARLCVDSLPEVLNWRFELPYCFFLVSEKSADELCDLIRKKVPKGKFLLTEVGENKQGYLSKDAWRTLNEKPLP